MPHERHRHLKSVLQHLAALSPLVGLVGHRQVGKTTLLEAISRHHVTFDDEEVLVAAHTNPKSFLPQPELLRLLRELALADGTAPNYAQLRRATGTTPIAQKKLLFALETAFVIRPVAMEGDYRGSALFFEGHAEATVLAQDRQSTDQR